MYSGPRAMVCTTVCAADPTPTPTATPAISVALEPPARDDLVQDEVFVVDYVVQNAAEPVEVLDLRGTFDITLLQVLGVGEGATIVFEVDDIEATTAELKGRGVKFIGEIFEYGTVKLAAFEDLNGNVLQIYQRNQ